MTMPESMRQKALRAIAEDRVRIVRANDAGIAVDVTSSRPDPETLVSAVHRTLVFMESGRIARRCSCPAPRRCYHLELAEMIWRPGPHERSER